LILLTIARLIILISKTLSEINEADLQSLVDNAVLDKKYFSFEQVLPYYDSEIAEFLSDVSSFANSNGGQVIFGISLDSKTGYPSKLEGFSLRNVNQDAVRLLSMIQEGIEPLIPQVAVKPIALSNSKVALVVRVEKSWNIPHRVKYKGYNHFFGRNTSGRYELDLSELRVAFSFVDNIAERIRKFREDRIARLLSYNTPVPFSETAKSMLHLIPLASFGPGKRYDLDKIASDSSQLMAPIYTGSYSHRYNFDGFVTYSSGEVSDSYVQLFRNGVVEVVEGFLLKPSGDELHIPSVAFEEELIESLPRYLRVLKALGVELPLFAVLTLVGVRGYSMSGGGPLYRAGLQVDRDVVCVPEVLINNYDEPASRILRPLFDTVWNACGFARSLNYDADGNWRPKR
jgi:hypothetical protein